MNKEKELEKIAQQIRRCQKCALCKNRTNTVPGEGNPNTKILFCGEGPGQRENELGRPFVGAAGKFLDELIKLAGFTRQEIFITNVVKCRPPSNRDPLPEEVETCWPYLEAQIKIIKPKLIITLGRHAMYKFLPAHFKISQIHGQPKKMINTKTGDSQVYYPVYHPAAALYHGSLRAALEKDFKKIPRVLKKIEKLVKIK